MSLASLLLNDLRWRARVIFAEGRLLWLLAEVREALTYLETVVVYGSTAELPELPELPGLTICPFSELLRNAGVELHLQARLEA